MQTSAPEPFETLRFDEAGLHRLDAHLARLARACGYLGISFSPAAARARLAETVAGLSEPARVRLSVTREGGLRVVTAPLPPLSPEPVSVGVALERCDERDPLRRHKTTARALYDAAAERAAAAGLADVIFLNRLGTVAEGAISNVFVRRDGGLVTPPTSAGALPGVLRGQLIAEGVCREDEVSLAELEAREFYVGNSLRGLRRAVLAPGIVVVTGEP